MNSPPILAADTATMNSLGKNLEAAAGAHEAVTRARPTGPVAPDVLTFSSQLQFLLTIGYLTKDQADALLRWFLSSGTMKLPALPAPAGVAGPAMYEILSTAVHFATPAGVVDIGDGAGADIGDFFAGLVQGIGDLIGTVTDGVTSILQAGTGLIEAGTQLVHEIHDLVVLSA